jgi:hypothetical protein
MGTLIVRIGYIMSEPVPEALAFAPVGVTEALTGAVAAPFFLVPLALLPRSAKGKDLSSPTLS